MRYVPRACEILLALILGGGGFRGRDGLDAWMPILAEHGVAGWSGEVVSFQANIFHRCQVYDGMDIYIGPDPTKILNLAWWYPRFTEFSSTAVCVFPLVSSFAFIVPLSNLEISMIPISDAIHIQVVRRPLGLPTLTRLKYMHLGFLDL
ncbi:hypothetical protein R3P38DRAFT_3008561 [Favolaschia claudopus]|uniref:Uncharacterized protein n=1 Tax=Favolaschia claudopus TaxID=2862362 RepID=A0AAW0AJM5_9AGAR